MNTGETIILKETTVGHINGVTVACGNIMKLDKVTESGDTIREIGANLRIKATELVAVFSGSVLDFNGQKWQVIEIDGGKNDTYGKLKLMRIDEDKK